MSEADKAAHRAYWEHRLGGGPNANPATNNAAMHEDPGHLRNSLIAGEAAREGYADPEQISWENGLKQRLQEEYQLSDTESEIAAIMVSVTPVGTALDVGEGFVKATAALSRGDVKAAMEHLGSAGMSAAKIGKIEKKLMRLAAGGSGKAFEKLAKALPDVTSAWMARSVAKQGLAYSVVKESIARGFKNGMNPAEALTGGLGPVVLGAAEGHPL
ncbi:hypothetical protein JCM17960_11040 [Magnetospira thiophila]